MRSLNTEAPFSAELTPHFTLGEFALNRPERRFTAKHQIDTAERLAVFLEQVRAVFGGPVIITSGYRPWSITGVRGGARFSEHLFNMPNTGAADFYMPRADLRQVERWCDERWSYSLGLAAEHRGFIHLGMRSTQLRYRWIY
jgi:hypothetical protein